MLNFFKHTYQPAMFYLPLSLGEKNIMEDDLKMQQCDGILSLKKKMHLKNGLCMHKKNIFLLLQQNCSKALLHPRTIDHKAK